jgi:NAD(P)-dependent dehydrogenase (short-subunit alcohol dehydrogenase family)
VRRYKLAIIGCGGVARLHAAAYGRHPERVEVVAACDPVIDRAAQLATRLSGCRLVFPGGGYYHASKYAVEAISDALRFEVAPFGIQVSVIEPGLIRTGLGQTAADTLAGSAAPTGPYAVLNASVDKQMAKSYDSALLSAPPEAVADAIEQAALANKPRSRYVVTPAAKLLVQSRRLLGDRVFDALLAAQFKRGKAPAPSGN